MQGNERMEEIMREIKEHLKPVIDYGANGNVHHYNRVWEKIDAWFHRWEGKTLDANQCCCRNGHPQLTGGCPIHGLGIVS